MEPTRHNGAGAMALRLYSRLLDGVEYVQTVVTILVYVTVIGIVFYQVVNRYLIGTPVLWTADLAIILFVWLGFLTASTAVRKSGHFRMAALIDLFRGTWGRRLLELFSLTVILILSLALVHHGWAMSNRGWRETSPGVGIRMFWAYLALPATSVTAALFCIERIIYEIRYGLGFSEEHAEGGADA